MNKYLIFSLLLLFSFSLKAEDRVYERACIHTDKDCYLAGEDILLKFYLMDNRFQPSALSKVGYVEICDTEKPRMQLKIALEKGHGAGKIRIPSDIPTGIYQLSGYTSYMSNEGEPVFFKKQIAIINAGRQIPGPKRFELIDKDNREQPIEHNRSAGKELAVKIKTNQNRYGNRSKVLLSIDNIPDNTTNLVVSVTGNDSIVFLPEVNKQGWLKQVTSVLPFSGKRLPEYEGHIITGRIIPTPQEQLLSGIALVGNDIRYINGQPDSQPGIVNFYTAGIFGNRQIVTSVISQMYEKVPYRIDLLDPYEGALPDNLPVLQIYPNEKALSERYIGVQIQGKKNNDSLDRSVPIPGYYSFRPVLSYDLDQYTRFGTVGETILEFVNMIHVTKVKGKRIISPYSNRIQFGYQAMVLLDGIPIRDHEEILRYNPMYIKMIHIYEGCYMFGEEKFECIVSFVTHKGDLSFFQLSEGYQLFNYDFPQLPFSGEFPDYSIDRTRDSQEPDFRHTLYWNPFVEHANGQPANLSFYTSDLCGEFKIIVEGMTSKGEIIHGTTYFRVGALEE